jgi:NADPH2:quinone reductase
MRQRVNHLDILKTRFIYRMSAVLSAKIHKTSDTRQDSNPAIEPGTPKIPNMKNLMAYYKPPTTFRTTLEDIPQLTASDLQPNEVLIKVSVAGSNPKDFKHPRPDYFNIKLNQGDDCTGTIAAIGTEVRDFRSGDRVAGFHHLDTPYGTYAESAICPAHTVFHLPESISDEEAATIPLAAFTAAVGLYRNLQLPAPWDRSDKRAPNGDEKIPLVVNAASTAVGSFAIKLAKMNPRIGPIIAIAGASSAFVRAELGVDVVLDYRSPTIGDDLREALHGLELNHVFDAANSLASVKYLSAVLSPGGGGRYTCTLPVGPSIYDPEGNAEIFLRETGIWYEQIWVGDVFGVRLEKRRDGMGVVQVPAEDKMEGVWFGAVMSKVFETGLANGRLSGHPYEVVEGGLEGVQGALEKIGEGNRGNKKFVTRIADTPGVDS